MVASPSVIDHYGTTSLRIDEARRPRPVGTHAAASGTRQQLTAPSPVMMGYSDGTKSHHTWRSSMSRAVIHETFGGPDVLEVREVPEPHVGPGEVRIRVAAVGLNPMDGGIALFPEIAARLDRKSTRLN